MKTTHFLQIIPLVLLAACAGSRANMANEANMQNEAVALVVSQPANTEIAPKSHAVNTDANAIPPVSIEKNENQTATVTTAIPEQKEPSTFAELKTLVAKSNTKATAKAVKRLNKLDKKYDGNYQHFKKDIEGFSTTSKVIAGIGIIGLLLVILASESAFGAFLVVLAAAAFILKWIGIIDF